MDVIDIENLDKSLPISKGDRIVVINNIDLTELLNTDSAIKILRSVRDAPEDFIQLVISRPIELTEVTLFRSSKGFGFTIGGGIGDECIPGDNNIYVTRVDQGGVADIDGRIQPGYRLVAIKEFPSVEKDFCLNNCTHKEAVDAIKRCKDKLVLLVAKTHFIEFEHEDDSSSDFEHIENVETSEIESDQEPYLNTNRCESNLFEDTPEDNAEYESKDDSNNEVSDDKDENPALAIEGSSIQRQEPKRSYVLLDSLHTTLKGIFKLIICVMLIQYFRTKYAHHNPEDVAMIHDLESRLESLTLEFNGKLNEMEKYADKFKKQSISDVAMIQNLEQRLENIRLYYDRKLAEMDKYAYKLMKQFDEADRNLIESQDEVLRLIHEREQLKKENLALQESNELLENLVNQKEEEIDAITDQHNNCEAKTELLEDEYFRQFLALEEEKLLIKEEFDRDLERLQEELLANQEKEKHYMAFIENLQNSVLNARAQIIN